MEICHMTQGTQLSGCSLTTWEVGCVGGGTEVQEGEDLRVYLWLIRETNTLLLSSYPSIKNK